MKAPYLPPQLEQRFDSQWQSFVDVCKTNNFEQTLKSIEACLEQGQLMQQLQTCWVGSEFSAQWCTKHPQELLQVLDGDELKTIFSKEACQQEFSEATADISNEQQLMEVLRRKRNRHLLRIIWRDFNRLANTQETIGQLSYLADACIETSQHFLHKQLVERYGAPRNDKGEEQQLLIIAMGKLGANELNLSSDIDLIFAYPEEGTTDHPVEATSNHQFFVKLGQKIIQTLEKLTADGFVFRVDMALRPHGGSGPLVCSFETMENYYQEQGRSWERYAMIKARVVTGKEKDQQALMEILRPFTYRRYIDYSVIESLRDMKALINREVMRRGYDNNVKLGAGGIREIEFIVQAIQLIRGGREPDFQHREILKILPLLKDKGALAEEDVRGLTEAYYFLRNTEHVLQGYKDQQTQQLPDDSQADKASGKHHLDCLRIAFLMGFENWTQFKQQLATHRNHVARLFKELAAFGEEEGRKAEPRNGLPVQSEWLVSLWEEQEMDEKFALVKDRHPDNETTILALDELHHFQHSKAVTQLQGEGSERLNIFMPRLLHEVFSHAENPAEVLHRILPFIAAVLRRSAYLVLLNENPQALKELVRLSAASPWIAEELAQHPVLLDELLDIRSLYTVPDQEVLADALRREVLRIPLSDLEAHMEVLRYFKQAHRLRIAASEVTGRLPLMKVSDYLTNLAEVILNHALAVAWHAMTERYGFPAKADGTLCDPSFIVIAYGKFGGIELSHNSDLDIVFIHGADPMGSTNHPESAIDNSTFYARLGQRLIHIMETRTHSGQLYEMDTQLRPSGESGMLVSTIEGFRKYQLEQAWTWEHQALVRARVVAGCPLLAEAFDEFRCSVLSKTRDHVSLLKDVSEMREKMRAHLAPREENIIDLKHSAGGIVDIEFMVQYAVLAWACDYPQLLRWPDNIRLLEELSAARLFEPEHAQQLIDAYKELRCLGHKRALQQLGTKVPVDVLSTEMLAQHRQHVMTLWESLFSDS